MSNLTIQPLSIDNIVGRLLAYNTSYTHGSSTVTDAEYDGLKQHLRELVPDHIFFTYVGDAVPKDSHLTKAKHLIHMGSVSNAMSYEEFVKWHNKVGASLPVLATYKADGLSINLEYVDGQFYRAITRGDGIEGEDVTANIRKAKYLPLTLNGERFTGSVRAEAILFNEDWQAAYPGAKTARNAAAGIVRRSSGEGAEYLRILAHNIFPHEWSGETIETMSDKFELMNILGFQTVGVALCQNDAEAKTMFEATEADRSNLKYDIDGVVFSVNSIDRIDQLGIDGEQCYRGQIAWKFAAMTAVTTLIGVELSVGHTGAIAPTAILDPVMIGGVSVGRASLANFDQIDRLGVKIGDRVKVSRQGDVIPAVLCVESTSSTSTPIERPAKCPVCGGTVGYRTNVGGSEGVILLCLNDECDAKVTGKINRWIKSIGIKGVGPEIVEALVNDGCVETPVGLYKIKEMPDRIAALPFGTSTLGVKRANKLFEAIEGSRQLTIDQLFGSLGIVHLGKRKVEIIRKAANGYLDSPLSWFTDPTSPASPLVANADVLGIPGIAGEIQKALDDVKPLVIELLQYITIKSPATLPIPSAASKYTGSSVCFTGCRPTEEDLTRIYALGIEQKSGVAKGLTWLVVKDASSTSNKTVKAKELGVTVIGYEQFKGQVLA